jgi:hypothetical protein
MSPQSLQVRPPRPQLPTLSPATQLWKKSQQPVQLVELHGVQTPAMQC